MNFLQTFGRPVNWLKYYLTRCRRFVSELPKVKGKTTLLRLPMSNMISVGSAASIIKATAILGEVLLLGTYEWSTDIDG